MVGSLQYGVRSGSAHRTEPPRQKDLEKQRLVKGCLQVCRIKDGIYIVKSNS